MSAYLKEFLTKNGVATCKTSSYNPQGNGQCERFNGTIWKTVNLALKVFNQPVKHWEQVLHRTLHTIRTLLCTATNATPHERFFSYRGRTPS